MAIPAGKVAHQNYNGYNYDRSYDYYYNSLFYAHFFLRPIFRRTKYPKDSFFRAFIFPTFKYISTCKIAYQGHNGYHYSRGDDYDYYFLHFFSLSKTTSSVSLLSEMSLCSGRRELYPR